MSASNTDLPVLAAELTPKQIVAELDRYIVGQGEAKKAVAIALRNRWRRKRLDPAMRDEVAPKNILMIGSTGVGKTEIARRLAALSGAPFVKVEATRYTEVGYHGRDVESMVRDLVKASLNLHQGRAREAVRAKAAEAAEERLLELLLPAPSAWGSALVGAEHSGSGGSGSSDTGAGGAAGASAEQHQKTREKLRAKLKDSSLDAREVEMDVAAQAEVGFLAPGMNEELGQELNEALSRMIPRRSKRRKVTVAEARRMLESEEADRQVDQEAVTKAALDAAENLGIIFIDEIDKVVASGKEHGPDISREGVQRDLLPIVEGASVSTRWGLVKTDHILFIAAGAFHNAKPSDLLPELQGRFPIRVELNDLDEQDFVRILTTPRNAMTKQYQALLETEGVKLKFKEEALLELARFAARANHISQNIGARRLHTILEKLLEEVSFTADELKGKTCTVDKKMVQEKLGPILEDEDLAKYIL